MLNQNEQGHAWSSRTAAAVAAVAILLLGGCATGPVAIRSTDQQVAPNRYMVRVSGSRAIAQNDVQRYVLRRAAQVTLQAGYTHFAINDENVEARTFYISHSDMYLHGPDYARRAGLWPEYPDWPQTHYMASADITLLQPNEAAGNPQAIDAASVR